MRTIYRYLTAVDDEPTTIVGCLNGPIVHVASRHGADTVEFWIDGRTEDTSTRTFRVYGTGHVVPDDAVYLGTTLAALGLVWHLYELKA